MMGPPTPFVLPDRVFGPFDRIYAVVTRHIATEVAGLSGADKAWLSRLVVSFSDEREKWNDRPELDGYRRRWARFRTRFSQLTLGAFLHIGYDLPRALADDWPGGKQWHAGPNELRGQQIYFDRRTYFPTAFVRYRPTAR